MVQQRSNDSRIRCGEGIISQRLWTHPAHLLARKRLGFALSPLAEVHHKTQLFMAVGMVKNDQLLTHRDVDRQFLLQFTGNGVND